MKRCAFAGAALTLAALALPLCLIRGTASAQDATGYGVPYLPVPIPGKSCLTQCSKKLSRDAKPSSTPQAAPCATFAGLTPLTTSQAQTPKAPAIPPTVAELIGVLAETNSKDTYVATVVVLGKMGADARPALGPALRHGERLKVFEGAFGEPAKNPGAAIALQALATIAEGQTNSTGGSASSSASGCGSTSMTGFYSGFVR